MSAHNSRAMRDAVRDAPPGRMKHYPADFTPCGHAVYNHANVAAALVSRHGRTPDERATGRICETCGATWEGDVKRHKNMPLVEHRAGIMGARGRI